MPQLSLDSLTLTDTTPMALIRAGDEAGFDYVSLYVQAPPLFPNALLGADQERECARILADSRVTPLALEAFDLRSAGVVESYRGALERGARLGARSAVAIHFSNPDRSEAADLLARFAEIAAQCGLATNLEPVGSGRSKTLQQGAALIRASGADVGIVFDPWHLVAAGGSIADLEATDCSLIRYVQLCDAPVPMTASQANHGAVHERLYPGDGEIPMLAMLRLLPRDVPVGIECPSVSRAQAGQGPLEQAREAFAAAHRTIALLD